jgi:hypothetical protein
LDRDQAGHQLGLLFHDRHQTRVFLAPLRRLTLLEPEDFLAKLGAMLLVPG